MSHLLRQICQGKRNAGDNYSKYVSTPDHDDSDWNDAVQEARCRGVPIAAFGDTKDKTVLHPGHLGYNFTYHWGNGTWTSQTCWDYDDTDKDERKKGNDELTEIGKELIRLGYTVWVAQISGSGKGYLSTEVYPLEEEENNYNHEDRVLFVFDFNASKYT